MNKTKFKFIKDWSDLNLSWKRGETILLDNELIRQTQERMSKYGNHCDLVCWGSRYRIPLSLLQEV